MLACCILTAWATAGMAVDGTEEMKIQTETVRTDGFSMDYFRFGQGKKVFVILPGLSVDSVMQYANAVAGAYGLMADEYMVYVFDRRKELPEEYSIQEMARDTAKAIRALGLEQVDLFGASQGGMIAMAIAVEEPELVRKLILGSTSARMPDERYNLIDSWVRLAKAGNAEGLYLAFGEALYPETVFEQARDVLKESAKRVTREDLERFVILAESLKDFDMTDRLPQITCPVLVIGSRDDKVLGPEGSEEIAEALKDRPDCELYMYDGYGHAVYDLAPDYKERMLRFLLGE